MRLTDVSIRNLKWQGKKQKFFDDTFPQFGVRVYKTGKAFVLMHGTDRRMKTIGRYPDISLSAARKQARQLLGHFPSKVASITLSEAVSMYLEEAEARLRPITYRDYKRYLDNIPVSGKLTDITRFDLKDYVKHAHTLVAIKVFFNWCVRCELLDKNPLIHERAKFNHSRERVLTDDELKAVWAVLGTDRFSTIVRLLILTGQRKGQFSNFDPDWCRDGVVSFPSSIMKSTRPHTIPVGDFASQYIPTEQLTFNGFSKSKNRLNRDSETEKWTLHDLRRTFASNHARLGTPIHIVERLLDHVGSLSGVAGIYNRYQYQDEMREACDRYENWLASLCLGVNRT